MKSAPLLLVAAFLLSAPVSPVFAADATVSLRPIRGDVIINRTNSAWESQQVQELCILPNPKDPARLVMFYSGVPATNRNTCFIGRAWALKSDPFTWHQDEHNPVFSPGKQGWDSGSIRLDAVLYLAEEDAYYIYYSGTTAAILRTASGWPSARPGPMDIPASRPHPSSASARNRCSRPSRPRRISSRWPRKRRRCASGTRKNGGGTGSCITPTVARTASSPASGWRRRATGKPGGVTTTERTRPAWARFSSPRPARTTSGTKSPKWQHWLAQWKEGVTGEAYREFVVGVANLLVSNAAGHIERWEGLAEHIDELPEPALDRVLAGICELAATSSPSSEQTRLWNLLRAEASKHRRAQGLEWALPESIVEKLKAAAASLAPADAVARNGWLFDSGVAFHVGHHGQKYEETKKLLLDRRLVAVREIWESAGLEGVLQIAKQAGMPWEVGIVAERAQLPLDVESVLPLLLAADEVSVRQFAGAFLGSRFDSRRWPWLESLKLETWPVEQAVALLVIIPFQPRLWGFAEALGLEIEDAFWKRTCVHAARLSEEQVMFVVSKLRACRRPFSVLDFVDGARHDGMKFSEDFLLSVLEGALFGTDPLDEKPGDVQMLQYHVTELFQCLQQSPQANESRLGRLEWACLKLLDGFRRSPVALHRLLSRDPKFFAEVMSHLYRAKSERGKPRGEVDETTQNLAEGA